jgi:hypothetical protein
VTLAYEVIVSAANYGLELTDALTGGPLIGASTVVETMSNIQPYLVNASRWVFEGLPANVPANFVITADFYVPQTIPTGNASFPNPQIGVPGFLASVPMIPRSGYPFPGTLTRVLGLVRLDPSIDPLSSPVPNATVTLTPVHQVGASSVDDPPVVVITTDDGQYTYWFLPEIGQTPPIANQLGISVTATVNGVPRSGNLPSLLTLSPNGVTNAPSILIK